MVMLTEVKIQDVDVTDKIIKWDCLEDFDDGITTGSLEITLSINSVLEEPLEPGNGITIKRGQTTATDEFVFEGQITQVQKQIDRFVVVIRDSLIDAIKTNITKSWDINIDDENGVGSEIFKDIVNNYVGLVADDTSVTSTGTDDAEKLQKFISRNEDAYAKMNELADVYGYIIKRKPSTGKVWFYPKGQTDYGTVNVGVEVINTPKWLENMEQLRNRITVNGGAVQDKITETFSGTGSLATFELSRTPEDTKVLVGGVEQLRGVEGSSTTYDYTVDAELKTFTFITGSIPASGTDNIVIEYGAMIPVPVVVRNTTSIEKYGGPNAVPHDYVEQLQEVVTIADAEIYGRELLSRYGTPFNQTAIMLSNDQIESSTPEVGNFINVIDSFQDKDLQLQITQIKKKFPHTNDEFVVGDAQWRTEDFNITTEEKIRTLLEQLNQNQDILVQLFEYTRTASYEKRYFSLVRRSIDSEILIWNHPTRGLWGTQKWGLIDEEQGFILGHIQYGVLGTQKLGDTDAEDEIIKLQQGKNNYKELLYDNLFVDETTSTGTLNTTTQQFEFDGEETFVTNMVALGPTYNFATVDFETLPTGDEVGMLCEVSFDNKVNWQTVVDGVRTAITNTDGNGVFLRLTNKSGLGWPTAWGTWGGYTTLYIGNNTDVSNQITKPAISLKMEE